MSGLVLQRVVLEIRSMRFLAAIDASDEAARGATRLRPEKRIGSNLVRDTASRKSPLQ